MSMIRKLNQNKNKYCIKEHDYKKTITLNRCESPQCIFISRRKGENGEKRIVYQIVNKYLIINLYTFQCKK